MVHKKLSISLKKEWATILLDQKKRGQRGKMEKPKLNTTQRDIHPSHTHARDQVLKRWHDLSKTRSFIPQNKWERYASLSLLWATQKPFKCRRGFLKKPWWGSNTKWETKSELKEMRACLLFWKSCKTSKYREKEVNHVLHRVVLGINIRRWRC